VLAKGEGQRLQEPPRRPERSFLLCDPEERTRE